MSSPTDVSEKAKSAALAEFNQRADAPTLTEIWDECWEAANRSRDFEAAVLRGMLRQLRQRVHALYVEAEKTKHDWRDESPGWDAS